MIERVGREVAMTNGEQMSGEVTVLQEELVNVNLRIYELMKYRMLVQHMSSVCSDEALASHRTEHELVLESGTMPEVGVEGSMDDVSNLIMLEVKIFDGDRLKRQVSLDFRSTTRIGRVHFQVGVLEGLPNWIREIVRQHVGAQLDWVSYFELVKAVLNAFRAEALRAAE